jgi:hypothetical protein
VIAKKKQKLDNFSTEALENTSNKYLKAFESNRTNEVIRN